MSEQVAVFPAETTRPQSQIARLREHLNGCIVGQETLIDRVLTALLADGHLLVEGAPGLAKTKAIRALAWCEKNACGRRAVLLIVRPLPASPPGPASRGFHPPERSANHERAGIDA